MEERKEEPKSETENLCMCDGFGRPVDADLYWKNTGLSQASIEEVKEYHRQHPVDPETGKRT